jgi:FdhD protein
VPVADVEKILSDSIFIKKQRGNHATLPLNRQILLLSGRVSFEMMQKALGAGIAIIVAISAPTSLAVEFARANNQTLVGFLRGNEMNVYNGTDRVVTARQ